MAPVTPRSVQCAAGIFSRRWGRYLFVGHLPLQIIIPGNHGSTGRRGIRCITMVLLAFVLQKRIKS